MDEKTYIEVAAFAFICIFGIIGNSLVIYIFKFKHGTSKVTPMELLIIYLACVDLLASIVNPPTYIYWQLTSYIQWIFGAGLCKVIPTVATLSVTMSLGLILLITIERCYFLRHPFESKEFTKRHVHFMVFLVLVFSLMNELTYIYHLQVENGVRVRYKCKQTQLEHIRDFSSAINNTDNNFAGFYINSTTTTTTTAGITATATSTKEATAITNQENQCPPAGKITNLTIDRRFYQHCVRQSCKNITMCLPESKVEYQISRIATILFRDTLFVVTFAVCNALVYKALNDEEHIAFLQGQSELHPTKTLKMILVMSIVFAVLVLPKDIFVVYYTITRINGMNMDYDKASTINSILKIFQSSNSIVNVFIYARLHRSFKERVKNSLPNSIKRMMQHRVHKTLSQENRHEISVNL